MAFSWLNVAATFIVFWPLTGYPLLLSLLSRRTRASNDRVNTGRPHLVIIIPTFNEHATIATRLRNLESSDYPCYLMRAIVVDSGSRDGTADLADVLARGLKYDITVIREGERRGKASAINTALKEIDDDAIAIVTDAPTQFTSETLSRLAAAFDDPQVGATTGTFVVTGEGGWLQRAEAAFWRVRNTLRAKEATLDSTPFLSGELCAFRRRLVDGLDEDTLADDMNIALHVRRAGHRVIVVEGAVFKEQRSNRLPELIDTKTRRATGGIQELIRFRDMLLDPKYGWFGSVILPSAMLYYLPLRVPAGIVLAIPGVRRARNAPIAIQLLLTATAALAIANRELRERVMMLALTEYIMIQGWRRYLTGQMDVRWQQERRAMQEAPGTAHED